MTRMRHHVRRQVLLLLLLLPHCQERCLHLPWRTRRTKSASSTAQSADIGTTAKAEKLGLIGRSTDVHSATRMPHLVMRQRVRYLVSGRTTHLRIACKTAKAPICVEVVKWLWRGTVSVHRTVYPT